MRVLHVIPFVSEIFGGPSRAIFEMCRSQNEEGIISEIATTTCEWEPDFGKYVNQSAEVHGVQTHFFKGSLGKYRYSPMLKGWLKKNSRSYGLIHIHSLFNYPTLCASRAALRYRIPYIVRTQGILYGWCLENVSAYRKKFYLGLFEKKTLNKASLIHFTTAHEKERCYFPELKERSYVLPLGIEKKAQSLSFSEEDLLRKCPDLKGKKILLYLARLHKIKGLDLLLPAIAGCLKERSNWVFVIAGSGDPVYVRSLKKTIQSLRLERRVFMIGHVSGRDKEALLRYSSAFVLSSYSENFGVSIVEAMQAGLAVALSDQIAIAREAQEHGAGLVFSLKKEEIRLAVEKIMDDEDLRKRLSVAGKRFVGEQYNWKKITAEQIRIYQRIIGR